MRLYTRPQGAPTAAVSNAPPVASVSNAVAPTPPAPADNHVVPAVHEASNIQFELNTPRPAEQVAPSHINGQNLMFDPTPRDQSPVRPAALAANPATIAQAAVTPGDSGIPQRDGSHAVTSKQYRLSTAATVKDLDKAFASATKALAILGIKLALRKPDWAELQPAMEPKDKKPEKAEFKLTANDNALRVVIDVAGAVTQLGEFDLARERDLDARRKIAQSMVEAGFMDPSELDQFKERADPKVVANQIAREIASVSKEVNELLAKVTPARNELQTLVTKRAVWDVTYDEIMRHPVKGPEFVAAARNAFLGETLDFIDAVAKRTDRQTLIETFIRPNAEKKINISAQLTNHILQTTDPQALETDLAVAAREVEDMIRYDFFPKYTEPKRRVYDKPIRAITEKVAPSEARLQRLTQQLKELQDQKKKLAA